MSYVKYLECVQCGSTCRAAPAATTCPTCGAAGILDVVFDYDRIKRECDRESLAASGQKGMWQFMPLLPIEPDGPRGPLLPGSTPLVAAPRLAEALGLTGGRLWLKDEGRAPTASLKDRASAIGVAKALETGAAALATASTGNAASSLAGACAAAGLNAFIFVPQTAAEGKVAQLLIFGATVFQVQGSYADAFRLATEAIAEHGWYNRLSGINPYLVEGKKTCGLEIAADCHWQVPDWVVVSVGDGCTVAGIARAFIELATLGWIDRIPRILGVQAEGSRAIHDAFHSGTYRHGDENTIADGIAVGEPRNWVKAVTRVKASGGTFVLVTDEEIRAAMRLTGRLTGVFAEPAAGAAVAGLQNALAQGMIERDASVAVVVSGSGLKDVRRAIEAAGSPHRIAPHMSAVNAVLQQKG
ncbi:MAG TPA: threonine synthase [Symbiobacteriaceae bacterium]|nr:threonine synthase [Symbiobacteriaceae bacterium]